jgi:uncharacterized protein (DUF2141 family)
MQKVILTLVLFITGLGFAQAQEKESFSVNLTITGMKSDKGDVYVALYNSENTFLKKPFKTTIVKVTDKKATAVFKELQKGVYAVSIFHDKNENKKMDTNFLGIPKEPIGMSNNAKGFMGPPKYKDAKFMVDKDVTMSVRVK